MTGIAIICEYNPFHRGHLRQLEFLRGRFPDACLTAVLAGSFVQRGEPAALSKYDRAWAAVRCGADFAVELPFPWSAQGAAFYAAAGVSIAERIGCGYLCFGSETGVLDPLSRAAERMETPEFAGALSRTESSGLRSPSSHIAAVRGAYLALYGEELPAGANDTLAIEYLRAAGRSSRLTPICIKREGGYTATAARGYLREGDAENLRRVTPEALHDYYGGKRPVTAEPLGGVILNFFRTHPQSELARYADLGGGIAGRLCSASREAADYTEFIKFAGTKKYTDSRLRRAALSALLGVYEEDLADPPEFTSLLCANRRGVRFLRTAKKRGEIIILTRPSDGKALEGKAAKQFGLSLRADELWALAAGESPANQMRKGPSIIDV